MCAHATEPGSKICNFGVSQWLERNSQGIIHTSILLVIAFYLPSGGTIRRARNCPRDDAPLQALPFNNLTVILTIADRSFRAVARTTRQLLTTFNR